MALDLPSMIFIFTSGVFTLFSPCSFPLLPAYISYYLGARFSVKKAVFGGFTCTLGLTSTFLAIGVAASLLGDFLTPYMPTFKLMAGVIIILLGVGVFRGVRIPSPRLPIKAVKDGFIGLFLFGIAYGLAAAVCSAPIFLSILLYAIASGGVINSIITFIIYAVGMGAPLVAISILVAMAKELALRKILGLAPWLYKMTGMMLFIIGAYLIYLYLSAYLG